LLVDHSNFYKLSTVSNQTAIFWFRRDLRLSDNAGLYHALRENKQVLPIFIFDTVILDDLDNKADARIQFILESLNAVQEELTKLGSSLLVLHGDPVSIFKSLSARAVYANRDYESYAKHRDTTVYKLLSKKKIPFNLYKDHVIFDGNEVVKNDGQPYTIFTPYKNQWKARLKPFYYRSYPTENYFGSLIKTTAIPLPSLQDIGFRKSNLIVPPRTIRKAIIKTYDQTRNFPSLKGTSRLGIHLRFGTVSIRQLIQVARRNNETWLNELIWREFFSMILDHFPRVEKKAFKSKYDNIEWRNDEPEFQSWCDGRTGYPLVDAGMRELNATGFMHNRVRMVVASFLTKHLLIDWRWGEAYFAKKLLDFDLASNNGGWQWAAGCGCDAAPYFRVFNPSLQAKRFDCNQVYIKRWIPEFNTDRYVPPIVDHNFARARVIRTYKNALDQ
jgi:deoxyribodipyrimidine photo-lyase